MLRRSAALTDYVTDAAFGRGVVWSMPAFANQRMHARNDKRLVCVDLSRRSD
ncbi:hypothetical protein [Botrimarina sp.]|uniref:hypothetical protein n=1 Tax=Botrimarina sp. TaxID=2795802 RepID=UPI0032EC6865